MSILRGRGWCCIGGRGFGRIDLGLLAKLIPVCDEPSCSAHPDISGRLVRAKPLMAMLNIHSQLLALEARVAFLHPCIRSFQGVGLKSNG